MITPSSNTVVEPLTAAMTAPLAPVVTIHYTRIRVTSISLDHDSIAQFDPDPMLHAAELLADASMDVIAWNGTSGAWRGTADDEVLCKLITSRTATPATTGTLAHLDALRSMGVRRFALAAPYTEQVCGAIVATYAACGFECCAVACLGITHNAAFADVSAASIRELVQRADSPNADAIVIICTNLGSGWLVDELEAELAKPVLDSGVVTVWKALRMAGVDQPLVGWGRLLAQSDHPAVRGAA
jgi:maleate isomerase